MDAMAEIDKKMGPLSPFDGAKYWKALQSNAGSSTTDYMEYKLKQSKEAEAARKPPTATDIVSLLQKSNFADLGSVRAFYDLLFDHSGPSIIPISSSSKAQLALQPSFDSLQTDAPGDTGSKGGRPKYHPYYLALTPARPDAGKDSAPSAYPKVAFQLGNLMATTAAKPSTPDWSDTGYVALLSPLDASLWIIFNYAPRDGLGDRVPIPLPDPSAAAADAADAAGPSIASTSASPLDVFRRSVFDVALLMSADAVKKWDPSKPVSTDDVLATVGGNRSIQGLTAAKMAEPKGDPRVPAAAA